MVGDDELRNLYLDLMKKCLMNTIYMDPAQDPENIGKYSQELREAGRDWPSLAHTMIGKDRLTNIQQAAEYVITNNVPGDFIETGVWRGGSCIFMRAILKSYGVFDRTIWVADSFEGLPPPDLEKYAEDSGSTLHEYPQLAISMDEVKSNFAKYDLLDSQVQFLRGFFRDTLPTAPIEKLAILRLDGDMYESTMDGLYNLYDKLSIGGFVIVDDYCKVYGCNKAINDFVTQMDIKETIYNIDNVGIYWQKLEHKNVRRDLERGEV